MNFQGGPNPNVPAGFYGQGAPDPNLPVGIDNPGKHIASLTDMDMIKDKSLVEQGTSQHLYLDSKD